MDSYQVPRSHVHRRNISNEDIFGLALPLGASSEADKPESDGQVGQQKTDFMDSYITQWAEHPIIPEALVSFLSRTYWARLWIVQEVLLAKNLLIACGDEQIAWSTLQKYLDHNAMPDEWLLKVDDVPNYYHDKPTRVLHYHFQTKISKSPGFNLIKTRSAYTRQADVPELHFGKRYDKLHEAIVQHANRGCVDSRDHVFALLGIIDYEEDPCARNVVSDYAVSAEDLYASVLQAVRDSIDHWEAYNSSLSDHERVESFMTLDQARHFERILLVALWVKQDSVKDASAAWHEYCRSKPQWSTF